jgi:magnesium transporter
MPLTLIASIGGMSEWTMMTGGGENWIRSYSFLLIGMAIIGGIDYLLIRGLETGFFSGKKRSSSDS